MNSSQMIKDHPNKIIEEIPYDLKKKEILRTVSMGEKFKQSGVVKKSMRIKPETSKKHPLKLKLRNTKIVEEKEVKLTMFMGKEKQRQRRKIPEIEEEFEIEKSKKIEIEKQEEKNYKILDKIMISKENMYNKKTKLSPIDKNIASIDYRKAQTPKTNRTPKIQIKDEGELSFKTRKKQPERKKTSQFAFENPSQNPTFADLAKPKKEVVVPQKTIQTLDKNDFGKLDQENKKVLNKMRKPIVDKMERESGGYTNQNSENGSHVKEGDEDHGDFNFDDFGF